MDLGSKMVNAEYIIDTVVLHVTSVCSHSCPFCYYTEEDEYRWHQNTGVLFDIIDKCEQLGVAEIVFVGGDPATHPDILQIGERARRKNIATTILSNTLSFRYESIEHVEKAFNYIETTVHGSCKEIHDAFCGKKGAFDHVINNLKKYSHSAAHIGIVFNLTPNSYNDLYPTVSNLIEKEKVPIDHIVLQRIAPVGRASKYKYWNLNFSMIRPIFMQIEHIESKYGININFEDTFPYCKIPAKYHKYMKPCDWGYSSCALDQNGNISLCCADPSYTIGNILDDDILTKWNTSSILNKKRRGEFVPLKCRNCIDYYKCRGGCVLSSINNNCDGDIILMN